jgi:hypothetical protein
MPISRRCRATGYAGQHRLARSGLLLALVLGFLFAPNVVAMSAASQAMTATTGAATVIANGATVAATVNDEGNAATYYFQWGNDGPWLNQSPEAVFTQSGAVSSTADKGLSASTESQQVSATIPLSPQYSQYAYRVVIEADTNTGVERVFGQPLVYEISVKDSPEERLEHQPGRKGSVSNPESGTTPTDPPPDPTYCRVSNLKKLTLARARSIAAHLKCGVLRIVGKQRAKSDVVAAQSPRPRTVITSTEKVTVWLRK